MQITFGMMEDQSRRQKRSMLDEVSEIIDFRKIEDLLLGMYNGKTGRPPIAPLILFKALLLESWYGLSDVEVVQEIHDRRSFERFVGEEVRKYHLDDSTLVKFRERLRDSGVMGAVWEEMDRALIRRGLVVKQGTIVDSTLVAGACRPESRRQEGPPVDEDCGYTVRRGQAVSGYKVHVGMDQGSGLIRKMEISRIEEHDHRYLRWLIPTGTQKVYGDKAYRSKEHERYLRKRRIENRILFKGYRNRGLKQAQKRANRLWSAVRSLIEPKMNDLKRWCSMEQMRYYGLERNRLWMQLCGLASNFKRAVRLSTA
jgi:transposase, IS5 family